MINFIARNDTLSPVSFMATTLNAGDQQEITLYYNPWEIANCSELQALVSSGDVVINYLGVDQSIANGESLISGDYVPQSYENTFLLMGG